MVREGGSNRKIAQDKRNQIIMLLKRGQNLKAFTLMEIMLAVVIVGLISGFGIPNYTKSMGRARERDAIHHLEIIREGIKLYMAREADTTPGVLNNPTDFINTVYVHLIEQQGNTYDCTAGAPYTCWARNIAGWDFHFHIDTVIWDIHCASGGCPL